MSWLAVSLSPESERGGRNLGDGSNEGGQGLLPNPPTGIVD